jgi:hypothetical protein
MYKDNLSIGGSAWKDMQLGIDMGIVGTNYSNWKQLQKGTIVFIQARDLSGRLYAVVGEVIEKLHTCREWFDRGGCLWQHNYRYTPLTERFHLSSSIMDSIIEMCKTSEDPDNCHPEMTWSKFANPIYGCKRGRIIRQLIR